MLSIEIIEDELTELASVQSAISAIHDTTNNSDEKEAMAVLHNQITHHIDKLKNYVCPLVAIIDIYEKKMITDTLGRTLFVFVEEHGRNTLKHFEKELMDFIVSFDQDCTNERCSAIYDTLINIYLMILTFINKCMVICDCI